METYVVLSDLQIPYHDDKATSAVMEFISDFDPHKLYCVGDELDSPGVSRWKKGLAGEYIGDLQDQIDQAHSILSAFRTVLGEGKDFIIQRSNHGDRIKNYVERYAPGLSSLRGLSYSDLLGLDELGIEFRQSITDIAPGWVMAHGDESGMNRTAGGTALGLARKIGKSVVCGHCFDDKTEILTDTGWKTHSELSVGTKVLTMNKESGNLEYGPVQNIYRYDDFDSLITLKAKGLDLAVTDGHGLVVKSRVTGKYSYPSAGETYGKEVIIPVSGVHDVSELPISLDQVKFLAWVMAEGHVSSRGYIRIAQSDAPDGRLDSLEKTIENCGYAYSKIQRYEAGTTKHGTYRNYDAYRFNIKSREADLLVTTFLDENKNPRRALANMSVKQMTTFIETYTEADGHRVNGTNSQIASKDREKLDFLQELAVRSGLRTTIWSGSSVDYLGMVSRDSVRVNKDSWGRMSYEGTVWCVTVPNGTLVVRRNGKTAITQNTHSLGLQHDHDSYNGEVSRRLYGFEVGHLMDLTKADSAAGGYLKYGGANWQQGFGILYVHNDTVYPCPVPIIDNSFVVEGQSYRW